MLSSYEAVMKLTRDRSEWLPIVKPCHDMAGERQEFAGGWVYKRLGRRWFPSLRPLALRGILEKVDTSRGGHRAYYRILDREGVGRALQEAEMAVSSGTTSK